MRDIYGNSWAVIAWLGEEKDESGKAIQLVQRLCDVSKSESATEVEDCLWSNPGHLGHGGWFALNQLMERTYWFRLWIIQEIVMGGPALLIRCGTSCVDWTSFCVGISFLQEHLWIVKDALLHRESALLGQGDMSWATGSLHLVYRYPSRLGQPERNLPGFLLLPNLLSALIQEIKYMV
ncbi:hypothetical protein B0J14DRAFT_53354 [Halenospora varia]|nr:hypothetical protein B0J14DRAFT_53354 [Halenospora varia]